MRISTKSFYPEIQEYVLQGQPLRKVKGSLHSCHNVDLEIRTSSPKSSKYFFMINLESKVHQYLFVCAKESIVVCLDPNFIRSLPLSVAKSGKYHVFNIIAEHPFNGNAYLYYKKGKSEICSVDVSEWVVPLYKKIVG